MTDMKSKIRAGKATGHTEDNRRQSCGGRSSTERDEALRKDLARDLEDIQKEIAAELEDYAVPVSRMQVPVKV